VKPITTAIFPVAGLGTRFLPVTKAAPKEMLPIVDKPVIQYVVEEAVAAGITHLVFVTSGGKRAIEDYFDSNYELEVRLKESGKDAALSVVQNILPSHVRFSYVRQPHPLGLGDAVLSAKHVVGEMPFAVLLADDIIDCGNKNCLQMMVDIYKKTQANIIAVEEIPKDQTDKYGIVSIASREGQKYITNIIEKPAPQQAPSNLAVTGRYILSPAIFSCLEKIGRGVGGEIQLTDAIALLLAQEKFIAYQFAGHRYDCGSRLGLLKATIAYAMKRPDLHDGLCDYLNQLLLKK
jgi:UTP--glucose-1-phosphate uridylyltransferase